MSCRCSGRGANGGVERPTRGLEAPPPLEEEGQALDSYLTKITHLKSKKGDGSVCRVSPRAQGGHDGARAGSRGHQGQPTVKRRSDQSRWDVRRLRKPCAVRESRVDYGRKGKAPKGGSKTWRGRQARRIRPKMGVSKTGDTGTQSYEGEETLGNREAAG
eukprot:Gb_41582 [translate_table: standard]